MTTDNIADIIVLVKLDNGKIHQLLLSSKTAKRLPIVINALEGDINLLEQPIEGIDIIKTETT